MLCNLLEFLLTDIGQLQEICLWHFSNIQNTAIGVSNVLWLARISWCQATAAGLYLTGCKNFLSLVPFLSHSRLGGRRPRWMLGIAMANNSETQWKEYRVWKKRYVICRVWLYNCWGGRRTDNLHILSLLVGIIIFYILYKADVALLMLCCSCRPRRNDR